MVKAALFYTLILCFFNTQAQHNKVKRTGDAILISLPITAAGLTLTKDSNLLRTWQYAQVLGGTAIATQLLKVGINKTRPDGGNYAFPSGHTSLTFCTAAFIQQEYGWKLGIPSYALASFTAWSRVHSNKHDYWDITAGALLGIGVNYLVKYSPLKQDLTVSLTPQNEGIGVHMAYQF